MDHTENTNALPPSNITTQMSFATGFATDVVRTIGGLFFGVHDVFDALALMLPFSGKLEENHTPATVTSTLVTPIPVTPTPVAVAKVTPTPVTTAKVTPTPVTPTTSAHVLVVREQILTIYIQVWNLINQIRVHRSLLQLDYSSTHILRPESNFSPHLWLSRVFKRGARLSSKFSKYVAYCIIYCKYCAYCIKCTYSIYWDKTSKKLRENRKNRI